MEFEQKTTHTVEFSEMELYGICELLEHVRNEVDVDDYEYGLINSFLTGAGYEKKTEIKVKANRSGKPLPSFQQGGPQYPDNYVNESNY